MNAWDLAKTRDEYNLYLSPEEKDSIRSRLAEPAEDGHIYADAVFEGGGVKGTAFIGALRCFDDVGIRWRKVAGTSAGAITAAMLATGLSMDELEQIIESLDYNDFLQQKTSRFIFNGSPDDDLDNPIWMLLNLLLVRQRGQYSSEPFLRWLSSILIDTIPTFRPFVDQSDNMPWYQKRDLKIVISDISLKEMVLVPDDLDYYSIPKADFSVPEAVRLSMTIPLFFEPGTLTNLKTLEESAIVDGGILSNFPLWIYDAPLGQRPKCPTFGFQLVEDGTEALGEDYNMPAVVEQRTKPQPIKGATGVLAGVLETMMMGRDRRHLRINDQGRVMNIYTLGISATKFQLSDRDKSRLYAQGYRVARSFLRTWNWSDHLNSRGF